MPTICLNMIVKNEAHVIGRCLAGVKPLIDYWVIVDTGSTDGTQCRIRDILKDIPGELHERPWLNFGHNRTEALHLARGKADYIFINDADEVVVAQSGFCWPELSADGYYLDVRHGEITFSRLALIANRLDWRYEGVLHEYLVCDAPHHKDNLAGVSVLVHSDGARSQMDVAEKYAKDALVLEGALRDEPDNTRYQFYLAQSYRDCAQWQKSLEAYLRRAEMGGWEEEVWYSLYEAARISERLQLPSAVILERYLLAYQYRPSRAEPLTELARYYREQSQYVLAHLFAERAMAIPKPGDLLFVDNPIYDWRSLDEYAVAAYWTGDYLAAEKAIRQLLTSAELPESQRPRIQDNLNWALRGQGLPDEPPGQFSLPENYTDSSLQTVSDPACPICAAFALSRHADTPYWICPACDAWFQHPEPPKVYHGFHEPPPESMPEAEREVNRALAHWLFERVMALQPDPIMDIGAKLPVLAAELQRLGCQALAMDGAPGAEPLGELLGVRIIGADFETWCPDEYIGRFRLITLIHTFEHFYDPVAALFKLRRLITDDGALYIRLPDHGVTGFERDLTPGHFTIHPFFHTLSSLRQIITETGGIFGIAETHPLQPGQRELVLRPTRSLDQDGRIGEKSKNMLEQRPIIGLLRPGAIGDILMTLNLIPSLRKQYPNHAIYYFCHPSHAKPDALGYLFRDAGVDAVLDKDQFGDWSSRCAKTFNLIGYPLAEGYPDRPMKRHLIEYFATEMGLSCPQLPALKVKLPDRPSDAPDGRYATLQMNAGWSKYKEWPVARWRQVLAALRFPVVIIGEEYGRSLAHSIALIAHADLHIGIDSFANHLTHYAWQDESGRIRQVPGVILFGSTQASASGYPRNINLTTDLSCQPCFREDPAISQHPRGPCIDPPRADYADNTLPACMDGISVSEVVAAIFRVWDLINTPQI